MSRSTNPSLKRSQNSSTFFLFLFLSFLLLFLVTLSVNASAARSEDPDLLSPFRVSVGGGIESSLYKEYETDGTSIMKLSGELTTVNLSTRFPLPVDLFWQDYTFGRMEGSFSTGSLDYDGATWDGEPYTTTTKEEVYRFQGYLGSSYRVGEGVLEPYGGLKARHWRDEIMGPGGYRRRITQLFIMGGTSLRIDPAPNFSLAIGGEYSDLSFGSVKSYLSDVSPEYNDPTVTQQGGYGLEGYVRTWVDLLGLVFRAEAYGRYMDIRSSDSAPLFEDGFRKVYEPANDTTIYGVNLSWVWGS